MAHVPHTDRSGSRVPVTEVRTGAAPDLSSQSPAHRRASVYHRACLPARAGHSKPTAAARAERKLDPVAPHPEWSATHYRDLPPS